VARILPQKAKGRNLAAPTTWSIILSRGTDRVNFLFHVVTTPSAPAWIQAGAALVAVGITYWLARITRKYVKITAEALAVSREQLASQHRVYAEFGLRNAEKGDGFQVWVVNLGTANFLVSEIHVRAASNSASVRTMKLNSTVLAGKAGGWFELPEHYYEDDSWPDTRYIDLSLSCVSSGETKQTRWRVFSLVKAADGTWKVYAGFRGLLPAACPECAYWTGLKMRTDGLEDLDSAGARRTQVEEDLQATHHLEHKSQWLAP
jgi:hypothetical protein